MSFDPFGSMQGFVNQFSGFMRNPMQYMMQKQLSVPQGMSDPNAIIQYLMNNGTLNQRTYNQLQQMAKQIQSSPQFAQMMGRK